MEAVINFNFDAFRFLRPPRLQIGRAAERTGIIVRDNWGRVSRIGFAETDYYKELIIDAIVTRAVRNTVQCSNGCYFTRMIRITVVCL